MSHNSEEINSQEPIEMLIVNDWLVSPVDHCTCYGGSDLYGHEPGCGLEPHLDLTKQLAIIRKQERLKIANEIIEFRNKWLKEAKNFIDYKSNRNKIAERANGMMMIAELLKKN